MLMNWTVRDWASAIVGWICGFAAFILIHADQPWKFLLVFLIAFFSAWIARRLIPG